MIQLENSSNRFTEIAIPVWSRQHGAYISLITSWLAGMLLSESMMWLNGVVLIFLLSGLNFGELAQDYLKKRFSVNLRKKIWIMVYGFLTLSACFYLLQNSVSFNFIFPVLISLGCVYVYLSLKREHKQIWSELLAFAAITLGGMLAYEPYSIPGMEFLKLWVFLFSYFGTSVFLVKARFDKVAFKEIIYYVLIIILLNTAIGNITKAWTGIMALIFAKLLLLVLPGDFYKKLRITTIGFLELGYCLLLIALLYLTR
jgi:hypothetical protein